MKTDLRVRYTKEIIQTSFLALLEKKSLSKITVKEVCDQAQINRGTFYKHYQNCYDLMDEIKAAALVKFDTLLATATTSDAQLLLLIILRSLQNHKKLFTILSDNHMDHQFVENLMRCYFQHTELWPAEKLVSHWTQEPYQTIARTFLAGGCSSGISYWLQSGMQESPEQLTEEITLLADALKRGLTAE